MSIHTSSIVSALAAAALVPASASAAVVSAVGFAGEAETLGFRSTSVPASFAVGTDAVYGTAGYQLFATSGLDAGADFQDGGAIDPTNDTSGSSTTLRDLPGGVTINDLNADFAFTGGATNTGSFPAIDNPALGFAPDVADVRLGFLGSFGANGETDTLFEIVFGDGVADAYRIGLVSHGGPLFDGAAEVTLASADGSASVDVTSSSTGLAFFDVTGIQSGDILTVFSQNNAANGGGAQTLRGVTFDVVPEPSSLALLGTGALLLVKRKRG